MTILRRLMCCTAAGLLAGAAEGQVHDMALSNRAVLSPVARLSVRADPCGKSSKSAPINVDSANLDTTYVSGTFPPGISIETTHSVGRVGVEQVSLSGTILNVTLRAQGDGTVVRSPPGSKVATMCVGARYGYIEVSVVAHYRALPATAPVYKVPRPDFRLAIDMGLLKQAVAGFSGYKLGDTIRLGEFGCGDPNFEILIKDPPVLSATGYLNDDGIYGTTLTLDANVRAQINENCDGFFHPTADATGHLTTIVSTFRGGPLGIGGSAHVVMNPFFDRDFPLFFAAPIPALTAIPIDITDDGKSKVKIEFGSFDGVTFTPDATPSHRDIPVQLNISSLGGSATDNATLIVDGSVAQLPVTEDLPSAQAAQA